MTTDGLGAAGSSFYAPFFALALLSFSLPLL